MESNRPRYRTGPNTSPITNSNTNPSVNPSVNPQPRRNPLASGLLRSNPQQGTHTEHESSAKRGTAATTNVASTDGVLFGIGRRASHASLTAKESMNATKASNASQPTLPLPIVVKENVIGTPSLSSTSLKDSLSTTPSKLTAESSSFISSKNPFDDDDDAADVVGGIKESSRATMNAQNQSLTPNANISPPQQNLKGIGNESTKQPQKSSNPFDDDEMDMEQTTNAGSVAVSSNASKASLKAGKNPFDDDDDDEEEAIEENHKKETISKIQPVSHSLFEKTVQETNSKADKFTDDAHSKASTNPFDDTFPESESKTIHKSEQTTIAKQHTNPFDDDSWVDADHQTRSISNQMKIDETKYHPLEKQGSTHKSNFETNQATTNPSHSKAEDAYNHIASSKTIQQSSVEQTSTKDDDTSTLKSHHVSTEKVQPNIETRFDGIITSVTPETTKFESSVSHIPESHTENRLPVEISPAVKDEKSSTTAKHVIASRTKGFFAKSSRVNKEFNAEFESIGLAKALDEAYPQSEAETFEAAFYRLAFQTQDDPAMTKHQASFQELSRAHGHPYSSVETQNYQTGVRTPASSVIYEMEDLVSEMSYPQANEKEDDGAFAAREYQLQLKVESMSVRLEDLEHTNALLQYDLQQLANKELEYTAEISRLQEQVRTLSLQAVSFKKPEPADHGLDPSIVKAIMEGTPTGLEGARTMKQKEALLEFALRSCQFDALIRVIRHLQLTTSKAIFSEFMRRDSRLINAYSSYLRGNRDFVRLGEFFQSLNLMKEYHLSLLEAAFDVPDPAKRVTAISLCADNMAGIKGLEEHVEHAKAAYGLLKRQLAIEAHDSQAAASGEEAIYKEYPRQNILGVTAMETLEYCYTYHPKSTKDKMSSPVGIVETLGISEKMAVWCALRGRCRVKDFNHLKGLMTKPMFSSKPKSVIGFRPFVQILAKNGAPADLVRVYANYIESEAERLDAALDAKLWDVAIQTIVEMKELDRMCELRDQIAAELGSVLSIDHICRIDAHLADPAIKWKRSRK